MIDGVAAYALGFLVGVCGGVFVSFIVEWSYKAYVILTIAFIASFIASVIVTGPSEYTTSVNWPFQIGVIMGVIVGAGIWDLIYDNYWPTE